MVDVIALSPQARVLANCTDRCDPVYLRAKLSVNPGSRNWQLRIKQA